MGHGTPEPTGSAVRAEASASFGSTATIVRDLGVAAARGSDVSSGRGFAVAQSHATHLSGIAGRSTTECEPDIPEVGPRLSTGTETA